ncbi:MAG TPA: PD-(D/E)XK nuclease family protein [Verrucomicrobiae bacterium]|nr:PD-(D/E)XK nuclease family protein [Verrucomicrobiae bacterium]
MVAKTSYTELSTLAECEQKWHYKYAGEYVRTPPTENMLKGTLCHVGATALWKGESWAQAIHAYVADPKNLVEAATFDAVITDVDWLMARYVRHYGPMSQNVEVIAVEQKLSAKIPGSNFSVYGYVDEMWNVNGKLWLVERKTMKDWSRLDLVPVSPQETLYYWLAQANGLEPYGLVFDAIRTYRWALEKPTQKELIEAELDSSTKDDRDPAWVAEQKWIVKAEKPTVASARTAWARSAVEHHPGVEKRADSESFEQLWLDRTDAQVYEAHRWARSIMRRRQAIKRGSIPIRNIGPFCKTCWFKDECFDGLAFSTRPEIELVMD